MNQYKGEAWLGEEPQIREETITETVSADIIVVGGGLAGVAAVRQAAEMGQKVLLFENADAFKPDPETSPSWTARWRSAGDGII